jgi:hypothetical protein
MTKPLYDTDFYLWTQMQTAALRAKDVGALDLEYLAEEIESLGKRDRRAVESYLEVGAGFSRGRAGIATKMRYVFGIPRQGFQRRRIPDAMPQRQHTL